MYLHVSISRDSQQLNLAAVLKRLGYDKNLILLRIPTRSCDIIALALSKSNVAKIAHLDYFSTHHQGQALVV
jgi:hypothetical protein